MELVHYLLALNDLGSAAFHRRTRKMAESELKSNQQYSRESDCCYDIEYDKKGEGKIEWFGRC